MKSSFTDNVEFVKGIDPLAAEIYLDKRYYFLTISEVADLRSMPIELVSHKYKKAKDLIRNKGTAWTYGLSNRAKTALIKNGYKGIEQLKKDIDQEVDLEDLSGIGHKVAVEIRRWASRKN